MNPIPSQLLKKANQAAIYSIYLLLAQKTTSTAQESLLSLVTRLKSAWIDQTADDWTDRDIHRLNILQNAVARDTTLANSRIGNLTRSKRGLTACSFITPDDEVFVVFKGTGSGEWIDNGEGLSGLPEKNIYITYAEDGKTISSKTVLKDYATDQQVEALNWFHKLAANNGWDTHTRITLSGHSKGGNKAQFIAIHSDLPDNCYSFDSQGFSPEALVSFRKQYGATFETRRQKIWSFAAENDYVNVLGKRLMPEDHIYYFESSLGFHYLEAMLDDAGRLRPLREQGPLSQHMEKVSQELMRLPPLTRQHATLGIMNIFQKYLGKGIPVNGDTVSLEQNT